MMDIGPRLCLFVAAGMLVAAPAFAQSPRPAQQAPRPAQQAPRLAQQAPRPVQNEPAPDAPAESLSKKLNRSNGVIHPKEMDPGIEKPAPKVGDPNVLPPPQRSDGAPAPQPK
jgi:hypothetical protein